MSEHIYLEAFLPTTVSPGRMNITDTTSSENQEGVTEEVFNYPGFCRGYHCLEQSRRADLSLILCSNHGLEYLPTLQGLLYKLDDVLNMKTFQQALQT